MGDGSHVDDSGDHGCSVGPGGRVPDWWCYPERCASGHEWGPSLITVSWSMCDCAPAWRDSRCVPQGVDPAGQLLTEKVGCQKLRGQKRIEMKY